MEGIVNELAEMLQKTDAPNRKLLRQHNIQMGLRDEHGAGVPIGATFIKQ